MFSGVTPTILTVTTPTSTATTPSSMATTPTTLSTSTESSDTPPSEGPSVSPIGETSQMRSLVCCKETPSIQPLRNKIVYMQYILVIRFRWQFNGIMVGILLEHNSYVPSFQQHLIVYAYQLTIADYSHCRSQIVTVIAVMAPAKPQLLLTRQQSQSRYTIYKVRDLQL